MFNISSHNANKKTTLIIISLIQNKLMKSSICLFVICLLFIRIINSWCLRTIFAGVTSIESVDFSSDGQYIVTG